MRAAALLLCPLVAACSKDDTPTPPDMSALLAAYDSPDGRLTPEAAPLIIAAFLQKWQEFTAGAGFYALLGKLGGAAGGGSGAGGAGGGATDDIGLGVRRSALDASGAAWARVTYKCEGWNDRPEIDAKRWGKIELQTVFREGDAAQILWGRVLRCKMLLGGERQRYDGRLRIHSPKEAEQPRTTIAFEGSQLDEAGEEVPLELDLQAGENGVFMQQRVEGHGGFVVGFDEVANQIVVRDRDGPWICQLGAAGASGTCERGEGTAEPEAVKW